MVSWKPFAGDGRAWDEHLARFSDANPFQSDAWARHKRAAGWTPLRLAAEGALKDSPGPSGPGAAVQFLVKRAPGSRVLWSRGGPVGDPALWDGGLRRAAAAACGSALSYIRIGPYREAGAADPAALGWRRPDRPLAGTGSFELDLSRTEEELWAAMSSNWSHNLRRGQKRAKVAVWEKPDARELASVYRELEAYKGLKTQHGEEELASMLAQLGDRLLLVRADGPDGKPVALRACAVWEKSGWDLLAAASPEGRKTYASYALLWELLSRCRARGVTRYDLGGADAASAKGVYDFKRGSGARPVEYLGEWDWARWSWLRRAANLAIAYKGLGG
ncbi:MAG: peptidoglycan bridge formation glycyltransferase FemA/FemB family protein [Elusimicrobia bacterium]|nr:peptidoglycan bridge formation glycyltransferase FemA/FemB family protein [Elusimicrobiota bacterium]